MSIVFDRVSVRFGDADVLQDISLNFSQRRIGIIGNNGSGKSTLARLINGLIAPTFGRVLVDGLDTRERGADVRRRVGFVFQNPDAQIVMPTVGEDAAFGPRAHGLSATDAAARADAALARFGLSAFKDRAAFSLSGGEKQSLALAGVLALEPEWIVFDEPTTMLDRKRAKAAMHVIAELPQKAIVVTHHVELLAGFERVIVLDGGRVVCDDVPGTAIAHYVRTYLMLGVYQAGDSVFHRATAGMKLIALALFAVGLSFADLGIVAILTVGVLIAWSVSGLSWSRLIANLKPVALIVLALAIFQLFASGLAPALRMALTVLSLVVAAALVSHTTRTDDMLDALKKVFAIFTRKPELPAFALVFVVRLVPFVAAVGADAIAARMARGGTRNPFAALVPAVIRLMRETDALAEALVARGFARP